MLLGGQSHYATFLLRMSPTFHAGEAGTDDSGHFCERLSILEILRSVTTTIFQLRRTTMGSHKLSYGASSITSSITAQFSLGCLEVRVLQNCDGGPERLPRFRPIEC